jgi:hypothetical protein
MGKGRPAESATICSNSVWGQVGTFGNRICDGLSGAVLGRAWFTSDDFNSGTLWIDGA